MKTNLQRLLFALFAVMVGTSVNAQETSGTCGASATWSYEGTTLTISGTGAMDDYAYGEAPWNAYTDVMKSVQINEGVTSVGNNAFAGFTALTSVTFPPEGFTSIGEYAFSGCTSFKNLNMPNTMTTIGDGAFSGSAVRGATIYGGVTKIGDYAFETCTNLEGVAIYEGVEEIGENAFDGCALTSVVIPSTVTTIGGGAFMSNDALETVYMGSGVTNIGATAFQGCTALTSVGLGGATAPTLGDGVFTDYDGVTPLAIDAFYVPSTTPYSGGWGGYAADKFKTVYESVWENSNDAAEGNGTWSFNVTTGTLTVNGTGILNVNPWMGLSAINPEIYTNEYPGFWGNVKAFVVGEGVTEIKCMGVAMQINCASVTLPNTLKYVGYSCLEECAFSSIKLPEGLETIDDYTFYGSKLTSLTIPSTVTYIGSSAFLANENLATITCLSVTPPNLGEYEPCFGDGSAITAIYVPAGSVDAYKNWEWDESIGYTGWDGWKVYADKIQPIADAPTTTTTFTYTATEKITAFDYDGYFVGATGVASHEYADGVGTVVFNGTVTAIDNYTFYYDSHARSCMTGITIPESVESFGNYSFKDCIVLSSVTFAGTPSLTTIGTAAFEGCKALTTIDLPESLTTLGAIQIWDDKTYYNNSVFWDAGLTSLVIPKNVTNIYGGAMVANCPITSLTVDPENTKFDDRGSNAIFETATDKLVIGCVATTVPDGTKAIGREAFFAEEQPFALTLPESVTSIEARAFHFAHGLTSINIPDGVTTLYAETFPCQGLEKLTLGSGLILIESGTFEGCTNLSDIYCYANPDALTWNMAEWDFKPEKGTLCHVADKDVWETAMPDAYVTFVGDLYPTLELSEAIDNTATITAQDGKTLDVTLTRTLKAGSYNTFAAPFNIDNATLTAKGFTAWGLRTAALADGVLTLTFGAVTHIVAGYPYIVKVAADVENPTFDDVTVNSTATTTETDYVDFVPTLGKTTVTGENPKSVLFLGASNTFYSPASLPTDMRGFRAYFQLKGAAASARSFALDFGDGEVTVVNGVVGVNGVGDGSFYSLDGRRVAKPAQKGVYVVNGKKVVIK